MGVVGAEPSGGAFLGLAEDARELSVLKGRLEAQLDTAKQRLDRNRRKAVAQDEDPAEAPAEQAMDAATVRRMVAKAQADAVKQARADAAALVQAQEKVRPLVGNVLGMDSAENVYRFALEQSGVDAKGVHASALPALVDMAIKQAQPQRMAADRNIQTNAALSRFKQA